MSDKIRGRFEAWYVPEDDKMRDEILAKNITGQYSALQTHLAFQAYQAAYQQALVDVVEMLGSVEAETDVIKAINHSYRTIDDSASVLTAIKQKVKEV